MFALVDVNNFYASCETVFRPDLKGKPIIVLSNNDGCVIARNAEAKALGVTMAVPFFKMREIIARHNVQVFSSNYALYADISTRVMTLLEEMAPSVEIYSIDEAFLDLTGVSHCMSLDTLGHQIKKRIKKEIHLNVCVGIAPTKTLAKLANFAAKKWAGYTNGVVDLSDPVRQQKLLAKVSVKDIWGVGRRLSQRLEEMGITSAADLARQRPSLIRKNFSVVLERTVRELCGEPCQDLEALEPTKQQIMCSRSFSSRLSDYAQVREAVCTYAERAAEKLRKEKQYCRQIGVFLRTSPHAVGENFYGNQATGQLLTPSHDTRDIIRVATDMLDYIWIAGHRYIKAGVVLSDFFDHGVTQLDLFDERPVKPGRNDLMQVIDQIHKAGKGKMWFAGQGTEKRWAMKREMLSPAYTTRISDLPVVK
ncbi:translesion error-prone DNA polymerase V subunit UmuC [Pantoea stewartii]|uniref:translesion error-prone DNA polymerase V subunit UmuC n=1 Tax=Pantoea stewartii TaxID=66269 RepID=UPI000737660E|nr:translesion error-prone DNA polymerase V subunit UmuC [Pantoea stewartii]KTS28110.1 DNA polymerase V subunit UmuC [Pantoea stewartii]